LLYGEISALCNKEGYCWAGNNYFAELYQANEKTIRNWISSLKDAGYISVSFIYVPGKKEIQSRLIKLSEAVLSKIYPKNDENTEPAETTPEKLPDDSTEVGKKFSIRGEKICHTYGKNLPQVGKISSIGGEKICRDNTTCNNTNTTTACGPPDDYNLPTVEKVAAEDVISKEELRKAVYALDKKLILGDNFYARAPSFMTRNGLGLEYVSWIYEQSVIKADSLNSYFFTIFFLKSKIEEFKAGLLYEDKPPGEKPPSRLFSCPVCGTECDHVASVCLSCLLPSPASAAAEDVLLYRALHELPPDKRDEYLRREGAAVVECKHDFEKLKPMIAALKEEFGLEACV